MTVKLSVSMVHHDGLKALRDCLESLYKNPPTVPFEVVVVDNVSTDGAMEMLAKEYPQVRVVRNAERHGFGENQNTGIRESRGEFVLLLNDDTLIHPGAFDALCAYLDAHPRTGAVGPRLLNADGSLQLSCYRFPSPFRCACENLLLTAMFPNSALFGDYRGWAHDSEREVDFISGAAMLVRREAIEEAGLFDPLFFMYAEETDWQKRMRAKGWSIAFTPSAVITHLGGQSSEGMKGRQLCEFHRSQIKFIRKHYGTAGVVAQRCAMAFGASLRLTIWGLIFLTGRKRETARKNLQTWSRLWKWWFGFGPHEGIAELVQGAKSAPNRGAGSQAA